MNEPAGIAMPSCRRLSWLWVCLVLSCLPAASAWAGAVGAGYAVVARVLKHARLGSGFGGIV